MCWENNHRHSPNSTETKKNHRQLFACCTCPDGLWYCVVFVRHWKDHSHEGTNGRTSSERTRSAGSRLRHSDIWGNCLHCCLLWFQRWRWYEQSPLSVCGSPKWPNKRSPLLRNWSHCLQTHDDFLQHIHRAQHQIIIWKSATQSDPPDLDPIHFHDYGWQNWSSVDAPPVIHVPLRGVVVLQLKCHARCIAVVMLGQTVVKNRPG